MAGRTARALGAVRLIRAGNRSHARILMYHRFPGPSAILRAQLAFQCEHLRRHYVPITLDQLAGAIHEGSALPANALAITVDDGYADFADAFPVFQSFELKVTLYVVSGFASHELWLWPDQLQYLIENTHLASVAVPLPGDVLAHVDTRSPAARRLAFHNICQPLIAATDTERLRVLEALPSLFQTVIPERPPQHFAALPWDALRVMSEAGLTVGCHTATHPIVSKLECRHDLEQEITGAKRRIEEMLGVPVNHFCYPNGTGLDFDDASAGMVKAAGFHTAVTTEPGLIGQKTDLFRLPRLGVEPDSEPLYFERRAAGYRAK